MSGSGNSGIAVPLYRHALELRPDAHATELGRASYLEVSLHRHVQESMGSVSDIDDQPWMNWDRRIVLVDSLIDLHFRFRMRREVLYLCWNIIDRYMTRRVITSREYKLLGCSALWIAAKAMDNNDRVPSAEELSRCCRYRYYSDAFVHMEVNILRTLGWILRYPTAEEWLQMLCHSPAPHNEEVEVLHSARFIMEITLYYREFIGYSPSAIALASLTLARRVCGKERRVLEETQECLEVVQHLDDRLSEIDEVELSEILIEKYSSDYYLNAAARVVEYYEQGGRFIGASHFGLDRDANR
ncbi:hypothetical protein PENSPDRAFT_584651 [Peniophora sp. CONT]|nr:hypothetical protein PENSPDRAFT_584651 [Peniophora sp. CONT]